MVQKDQKTSQSFKNIYLFIHGYHKDVKLIGEKSIEANDSSFSKSI